jgi:transcriptional regulator with XRE-family HTH domain
LSGTHPGIHALVGRRIREERKARRLTQAQLASAAGIDTSHLSRIENDRTQIGLNALQRIADALGVPVAELFRGIPVRKPADPKLDRAVSALLRDAPPRKRGMILRVLKTLVKDD